MATYGYGPPPPPPPPSQPSGGYGQYQPSYQHGPQHNRGGRGGANHSSGRSNEYPNAAGMELTRLISRNGRLIQQFKAIHNRTNRRTVLSLRRATIRTMRRRCISSISRAWPLVTTKRPKVLPPTASSPRMHRLLLALNSHTDSNHILILPNLQTAIRPSSGGRPLMANRALDMAGTSVVAAEAEEADIITNVNGRQYGRGGYQNTSYRGGRPNFGGDKMRHKKISGGPIKAAPSQHHQKPDAASAGKKKKRKTNTLGLTPGEESDEEDVDEEAKLVEMIGPDAPKLDNLGEGDKANKAGGGGANGKNGTPSLTALERQQQKAEKLRKQLEKVESSIKRKREQQDEGDDMRGVDGESSDASSDSKSDDEAPEAMPIRSEAMPPAPRRADHSKHCKYYSTGGTCGKKGKCRFVHDPAVRQAALQERERNGGRMTLQQRLILNDKDQEDLTIVKTLQYLKEKGIMKDGVSGPSGAQTSIDSAGSPAPESPQLQPMLSQVPETGLEPGQQPHGLPKQPPSSLLLAPPNASGSAPTVQYQGWNLSGFGNTGVKSSDP
ncbi:zinc finger transcription factor [Grosmannia clavigera kw1407]|uniref:Zinc finger transcription factor n=1 Tax=Grosmannia clavigera (strain kw1407 / UAMH 11150) TaxID=655863 RepID=F0XRQ7_GROCL|nr:zinc finger transcription factor [Grosmannia clavigera kw1407]EFW99405.1 zinc finger transcription factor [Grosmannia clavigera kw1407]